MAEFQLIAVKPHFYAGRRLLAGDTYFAKHKKDYLILIAIGKADCFVEEPTPAELPKPIKKAPAKKATKTKKTETKKAPAPKAEKPKKAETKTKELKADKPEEKEKEKTDEPPAVKGSYERRDMRSKR